ncbi:MAG TPA: hypothetical protein VM537_24030 [Anaerolineae bacterium]|nr:hypothetical protein [Anaerolineae bacterium]
MSVLIQLVADYAPWIYALCGLIAVWYLREALRYRRERKQAMYTLERESALGRVRNIFGVAFTLLVVMGLIYYISNYLTVAVPTPSIEEEVKGMTPTVSLLLPTPTPTPEEPTPTPTLTATPRPRPTLRPTEETTPEAPPVQPAACPDPRSNLTWPGVNAVLSGAVQVTGTAHVDGFNYYKLEYGIGPNPTTWNYILQGDSPVFGGVLGTWDVSPLAEGVYSLQLKVVDQTGNWIDPPCQVQVTVGQ